MGQSLEGSGVGGCVCSYVWVVDDKCVDVVVRYDVGHNLLIFLGPLHLVPPTLLFPPSTCLLHLLLLLLLRVTTVITLGLRLLICIFATGSTRARSSRPFLVSLEDYFSRAFVRFMLQ